MNSGKREDILGRLREALRVPAPRLHAAAPAPLVPVLPRAWLPAVPDAEGQLAVFQRKELRPTQNRLQLVSGVEAATKTVVNLHNAHQSTMTAAHHHSLLDQIVPAVGLETQYTEERPDSKSLKSVRWVLQPVTP